MDIYSIDIGGSSIKHGVVRVEGSRSEVIVHMPLINISSRSFYGLREQVISAVKAQAQVTGQPIDVAISTTGAVSRSGLVWSAGHFNDYINIDWKQILRAELPELVANVVTVNDGKASTWAEYQHIGLGTEIFVHFVVGSGVGGGIVCFGRLLYGDDETAGAMGHMKVGGEGGFVCSCGNKGCVETFASSYAIAQSYAKLLEMDNKNKDIRPTFEEAFLAARDGIPQAIRAFELAGEWLGVAISNVINVLNPKFITIGGGVMLASAEIDPVSGGPYLVGAIRRAHELAFKDIAEETVIRPASAGNDGGLLGAAMICALAISHGR